MQLSLIDTDILSEFLKRKDPIVVQKAADYLREFERFAISAISQYEVMRGLKEKNAVRQLRRFAEFCEQVEVYPISSDVLERASDLWALARRGGRPGRDPDLMIAATALEHERVLVTGNVDHFSWIPALTIENWRIP
jgi:tRNA(fMet)-specific endonuclease VapC